jgi:hypothetical protein
MADRENNRQKVAYVFIDEFHSVCMDKRDIIRAEIEACERLLKYATGKSEKAVVEKEIADLKTALDLMP